MLSIYSVHSSVIGFYLVPLIICLVHQTDKALNFPILLNLHVIYSKGLFIEEIIHKYPWLVIIKQTV